MDKTIFLEFYNNVVKTLGKRLENEFEQFHFCDNPHSLYEEYLNQKTMFRTLYEKKDGENRSLLDRHKVCACMTVAITKVRLVSGDIETDNSFSLSSAARINEQLAFMSTWELFLGFLRLQKEETDADYQLPDTYHNISFLDTFTRSLFFANQLNSLSTPLIANIFFLLEKYLEVKEENSTLKSQLEAMRVQFREVIR